MSARTDLDDLRALWVRATTAWAELRDEAVEERTDLGNKVLARSQRGGADGAFAFGFLEAAEGGAHG